LLTLVSLVTNVSSLGPSLQNIHVKAYPHPRVPDYAKSPADDDFLPDRIAFQSAPARTAIAGNVSMATISFRYFPRERRFTKKSAN
jgi:hypothetical protein